MRLFLCVNWSDFLIDEIEDIQEKLKRTGVRGYWRRNENLHLTLKFLGETSPSQVNEISSRIEHVGNMYQPFEVNITGLGVFPNIKSPRILWLGVESPLLLKIQSEIETNLRTLGFSSEARGYQPHITIASGGIKGLNIEHLKIGTQIRYRELVTSFYLMESLVSEGRRVYREIQRYDFRR